MEGLKTILFYILGLAGLVVASVIFTAQVDELPAATPAGIDSNIAPLAKIERSDCVPPAMSISYIYVPNAPFTTTLAPPNLKGERLLVSGTVYASNGVIPLPEALVEVWQADADGQYENLRAQMRTDTFGRYQFTTIKPGHYRVDCRLLPAHIHYRVSHLDNQPLFTLLFFQDDPYLASVPSANPAHIRPLTMQTGPDGLFLHTTFDLILPITINTQR